MFCQNLNIYVFNLDLNFCKVYFNHKHRKNIFFCSTKVIIQIGCELDFLYSIRFSSTESGLKFRIWLGKLLLQNTFVLAGRFCLLLFTKLNEFPKQIWTFNEWIKYFNQNLSFCISKCFLQRYSWNLSTINSLS